MVYLDLLLNLSLLIALSVVSVFIEQRWPHDRREGVLLQGLLFGAVAVIGMLRPLTLGPGLIFDGRSVMVSLCALIYGPLAAAVAVLMTVACRLSIGGPGTLTGVLVILSSAGIGLAANRRFRPHSDPPSALRLYVLGLAVHAAMVALMFTLPGDASRAVIRRIGLPVLFLFPLATILAGKILSDQMQAMRIREALRDSEETYRKLFEDHSAVKMIIDPVTGTVVDANAAAADFYGWPSDVLRQMTVMQINTLSPDEIRAEMAMVLRRGRNFYRFRHRRADGSVREVEVFSSPIVIKGRQLLHSIIQDVTDRVQVRAALERSEERFRSIVEGAPDPIFIQHEGRFAYLNPAAVQLLGAASSATLIDTPVMDRVHPDFHQAARQRIHQLNEKRQPVKRALQQRFIRLDGSPVWVETVGQPIVYDGKEAALVFVRDISERKDAEAKQERLQAQLLQAQKMEAVGRLAGGVAHDFNNMLSVILGYSEMALDRLTPQTAFYDEFSEIHKAAQRSATITRQLLAFARQQTIAPVALDLNDTVAGMLNMLRRLIGEDIDLVWKPGAALGPVKMDPGQIDQILANLVVNARDAIAGVGKVTIETGNVVFDAAYCAEHAGFILGRFVMLAISDDGCGMDQHTMDNLFEPFFTTKAKEKGTGLGLATVYGIVKQNNGFINVYSEPGEGTTIRIYLPWHEKGAREKSPRKDQAPVFSRDWTILVVEDETAIRQLAEKMLKSFGLVVIGASTPRQAIDAAERYNGRIDLLLTDVVMPEMNGRDLAAEIRSVYPALKVLFMSGYTANVIAHHGVLDEGVNFIQKPFSKQDLSAAIRRILGEARGPTAA
ncbi:MAG: PAS domain S-box protein [Desulfobacteraceae bacterium]|nr:PAS domain S-box protein [Desulfobacteraceae bacterium]